MKTCSKCKVEKELDQYAPRENNKLRSECRECLSAYQKTSKEKRKLKPKPTIVSKICKVCNTQKDIVEFNKDITSSDGFMALCKVCRKPKSKAYYEDNKINISVKSKEKYHEIKSTKEFKDLRNKRQRVRLEVDPLFKIVRRLRNTLYYKLIRNNWKKGTKFTEYIGLSDPKELISYLIGKLGDKFTGSIKDYDIDHIIPLSSAKNKEDLYKLCHYTNLRLLDPRINRNVKKAISNFDLYEVRTISYLQSKELVEKYHYTKIQPNSTYYFGLYKDTTLIGACSFSTPFSKGIREISETIETLELNRLVLVNNLKNEASYFINNSIKMIQGDKIIISFADPSQGHKGTIYKACNFIYYGLTQKRKNMKVEGRNTHALSTGKYLAKNKDIEYTYEDRVQKHRFIFIKGNKRVRQRVKSELDIKFK
jgi:hypothetical protein